MCKIHLTKSVLFERSLPKLPSFASISIKDVNVTGSTKRKRSNRCISRELKRYYDEVYKCEGLLLEGGDIWGVLYGRATLASDTGMHSLPEVPEKHLFERRPMAS